MTGKRRRISEIPLDNSKNFIKILYEYEKVVVFWKGYLPLYNKNVQ